MAFSRQARHARSLRLQRLGAPVPFILLLVGCASDLPPTTAERVLPPMPSMGSREAPKPETPESEIVARALSAALNGDFTATQKILDLAPSVAARASAAEKVVTVLADQAPPKAARVALELPSGPKTSTAIEIAATAWTQRAPDEALRWSIAIEDPASANVARRAVTRLLVDRDPSEALGRIQALPVSRARDEMVGLAAGAWARRDANAAVRWLEQQPNDARREQLASTVAFELAQVSPARAIELAETLPVGRNRWLVFSGIAQTWVALDQDAAIAWANRLQRGEAHDAAIAGINTGLGVAATRRSPMPSGAARIPRGRATYAIGPDNDPPAFSAWLATQPQTMSREEAIVEYVRQRGSQDGGAIGSWLANLPGEPARSRALDTYFQEVVRSSPATAANWLRSLPSSDRSDEMIETVARRWLQTDPRAAEAWLRETNLSPVRQEELLRQIPH